MNIYSSTPVATTVVSTGLPVETWPETHPLQAFGDGIVDCELYHTWSDNSDDLAPHWKPIKIHNRTLEAIQNLPVNHILGYGVLIRTASDFTALVSIAEAGHVHLGSAYLDLLCILLEFIAQEIRAHELGQQRQQSATRVRREISSTEHDWKLKTGHQDLSSGTSPTKTEKSPIISKHERTIKSSISTREDVDLGKEARSRYISEAEKKPPRLIGRVKSGMSLESTIEDQITEIQQEQKIFNAKLDSIFEQNEQMLKFLKELSHSRNEAGIALPSQPKMTGDISSGPVKLMLSEPTKYYEDFRFTTRIKKIDEKYSLWVDSKKEMGVLANLMDWLELALGGTGFMAFSSFLSGCIRLEGDTLSLPRQSIIPSGSLENGQGCWRKKILSGNILSQPTTTATSEKAIGIAHGIKHSSHPFHQTQDGLALTMAALWSLYDNELKRVPNCNCTFTTDNGDFIQCKSKSGKWYLWHTFSEEKPCEGEQCEHNVCVALNATENGERVWTTSPCILGWAAQGRTKPDSPVWSTLGVTSEFRKKEFTKYKLKEIQALAQLSVPTIISPQFGGAFTFSKLHYEVANSIDHTSRLATDMAANTVVLIFDERRGHHFSCDGADIIEMLCLQYLKQMGHDASDFPLFTHPTALQRLGTWYHSSFVSSTGVNITGDYLVREASKKVSQLLKLTRTACQRDSVLLYWLLEDILKGGVGKAFKAPRIHHISWHELALKYPPLILAVGDVDPKLVTATGDALKWTPLDSKSNFASKLRSDAKGLIAPPPAQGGIVGSHIEIRRWLLQAQPFYFANICQTKDKVVFGDQDTDSEFTYQVTQANGKGTFPHSPFAACKDCTTNESHRCLHYIQ